MLENVQREIFFHDNINKRIYEIALEQGKEIPKAKPEFHVFLRVPVLDEYVESIIKKGFWEGIAFMHSFENMVENEVFESAVISNTDQGKYLRISIRDLYVEKQDFLHLEQEIGATLPEKQIKENANLHVRAETTYLNIIGTLLEVILGEGPLAKKHPSFLPSQATIN